ncbi:hypothetical protein D3C86_2114750 [compost metagenome]
MAEANWESTGVNEDLEYAWYTAIILWCDKNKFIGFRYQLLYFFKLVTSLTI